MTDFPSFGIERICGALNRLVSDVIITSGFFRQNTSGYALGVLTPKASPSGWVFSQAQQPMIKTYNYARFRH